MERREFLKGAQAGGIMLLGMNDAAAGQDCRDTAGAPQKSPALTMRPYQLLCLICSVGEELAGGERGKLQELRDAIREHPDRPVTLVCNAGDVYCYQDPGPRDDMPPGQDFNQKRDLDILQILNLEPGCTLPARALLLTLLKRITTVPGICGYRTVTAEEWRGCPKATSGNYEKGHAQGIASLIPPRTEKEMAAEKQKSLAALYAAKEVTIRPHILLCAVCQYGGGTRPPYPADNLPELVELIVTKAPQLPIRMARQADWMMCAPCPQRVPQLNACVNVLGSGGLSNEKRDLDMLQKLGLHFGSSLPAKQLFQLIFERIPTTQDICGRENQMPSVWWDPCGESNRTKGNPSYDKGRKELMAKLGLNGS
jgi:hypothetical protein